MHERAEPPRSLRKVITARHAVALYVSSVLGSGILVLPVLSARLAGPGSLIAWVVLSVASYPFAAMFSRVLGHYGAAGTAILAVVIIFSAINAYTSGLSRVVYAAALDGSMPRAFSRVSPANAVPSGSLLLLTGRSVVHLRGGLPPAETVAGVGRIPYDRHGR